MRAKKSDVLREVWKSVAVPSVMYGMEVIAWNENKIDKSEVGQNRAAIMALNAPRYAAVGALRGDVGWIRLGRDISDLEIQSKAGTNGGYKNSTKSLLVGCKEQ